MKTKSKASKVKPKRIAAKHKYPKATITTATGIKVRSKLEQSISDDLTKRGIKHTYEDTQLTYTVPEKLHKYTPDFKLEGQDWFLEAKGFLDPACRARMIHVKNSNIFVDIRFVFQQDKPIRKGSKTKYSDWATKNGFLWAIGQVPEEWLHE